MRRFTITAASIVYAALFIVFFALSITASAFDWIASLDPSWFSTMFAVYVFAGTFVAGNRGHHAVDGPPHEAAASSASPSASAKSSSTISAS